VSQGHCNTSKNINYALEASLNEFLMHNVNCHKRPCFTIRDSPMNKKMHKGFHLKLKWARGMLKDD